MTRACRFKAFGSVVDKKLLLRIGGTLVTVISTVGPLVIGMRPDINEESVVQLGESEGCALTEAQQTLAQGMFSSFNATCTYNLSVGSRGVTVF